MGEPSIPSPGKSIHIEALVSKHPIFKRESGSSGLREVVFSARPPQQLPIDVPDGPKQNDCLAGFKKNTLFSASHSP